MEGWDEKVIHSKHNLITWLKVHVWIFYLAGTWIYKLLLEFAIQQSRGAACSNLLVFFHVHFVAILGIPFNTTQCQKCWYFSFKADGQRTLCFLLIVVMTYDELHKKNTNTNKYINDVPLTRKFLFKASQ